MAEPRRFWFRAIATRWARATPIHHTHTLTAFIFATHQNRVMESVAQSMSLMTLGEKSSHRHKSLSVGGAEALAGQACVWGVL
jgi:hypothetical protein